MLVAMFSMAVSVHAEKKPKMQTVYVFGFSASFTDSLAFLTDVMQLDSAYIMPNGFLADRQLYSLQLENFVLGQRQVQNSTNAIFFSTRRKDLEKKYEKVNRKYQRSTELVLLYVGEDEFKFQPQEYIDPNGFVQDPEVEAVASGVNSAKKGGKP